MFKKQKQLHHWNKVEYHKTVITVFKGKLAMHRTEQAIS